MIGMLCLAIGLVGQWLLGVFIGNYVLKFRNRSDPAAMELYGLGCALGVGGTAWILFMLSFCGVPLGSVTSAILTAIGYLAGGPIVLKQFRQRRVASRSESIASAEEQQDRAVCHACQSLIAILFVLCVLQTLQTPQKLWDERAIFALKARVLFEDRSIRSQSLMHPDFVQYHPRYPLLLPLAEEHVYALLGYVDDRLSKLVFSLLYMGLVLTTAGVLSRHLRASRAWIGALLLATIPVLMPYEYGFLCGQADAPVACYHGISVLYLWDSLKQRSATERGIGSILLSGICAGLTAFTKDEGIAYFMIDTSILGLFTLMCVTSVAQLRTLFFHSIVYVASSVALLLPWFLHRRNLPLTTEMNYFGRMSFTLFLNRLDTVNWSVPHLVNRMFGEWREWGLQWWLMLAAIVSRPFRVLQLPQLFLVLDILGALASLLVAGIVAPAQLDEHIGGSSHRFLMHIAPVAVLLAVATFASQDEPASP